MLLSSVYERARRALVDVESIVVTKASRLGICDLFGWEVGVTSPRLSQSRMCRRIRVVQKIKKC